MKKNEVVDAVEKYSGKVIKSAPTKRFPNRKAVYTENHLPSKTDQSKEPETNANNVVAQYYKNGTWPASRGPGIYADLSSVTDLMGAYETVQKASEAFDALPAQLRERLNNDPQQLITYLNDPRNDAEAIALGIKVGNPSVDNAPGDATGKTGPIEKSAGNKGKARVSLQQNEQAPTDE